MGREGERERERERGRERGSERDAYYVLGCLVFSGVSAVVCCSLVKGGLLLESSCSPPTLNSLPPFDALVRCLPELNSHS